MNPTPKRDTGIPSSILVPAGSEPTVPLCVDLDGTVVRCDTLFENLVRAVRQTVWIVLWIPVWLIRGRAELKRELANRASFDAANLPYRLDVIEWLRTERAAGRRIVLASATEIRNARAIAEHLGLFDEVIATQGENNLRGVEKLGVLRKRFGGEFDYVGNDASDLVIWQNCRHAIVVNAPRRILRNARNSSTVTKTFEETSSRWNVLAKALRVHQWSKNLLVLIPAITAHRVLDSKMALYWIVLFACFSMCASAVYILNDLADLDVDRAHPTKRERPLASGHLAIVDALKLGFGLLIGSFLLARFFVPAALWTLALYFAATCLYSLYWKRAAILDGFVLSGLYVLRIIAGHTVGAIPYSPWLLSFSGFIFLSLAFCKRVSELATLRRGSKTEVLGRGYRTSDLNLLTVMGIASGYSSVILFTLYTESDHVQALYREPGFLLMFVPLLLAWITRLWFLADRGEMNEDPVLFATRDKFSYAVLTIGIILLLFAYSGWVRLPMFVSSSPLP